MEFDPTKITEVKKLRSEEPVNEAFADGWKLIGAPVYDPSDSKWAYCLGKIDEDAVDESVQFLREITENTADVADDMAELKGLLEDVGKTNSQELAAVRDEIRGIHRFLNQKLGVIPALLDSIRLELIQ